MGSKLRRLSCACLRLKAHTDNIEWCDCVNSSAIIPIKPILFEDRTKWSNAPKSEVKRLPQVADNIFWPADTWSASICPWAANGPLFALEEAIAGLS